MKCEDMRKTVEKKVKRWRAGAIVIIMAGIICGGIHSQIYAGEFGGFDIDIGGDGGTFDDWTEEPEAPQEPAKPEQSPNGGSSASSPETNNNNSTSSSGTNNNSNASGSGANNNGSVNNPETSNNSSEGSQGENTSSNEGGSWGNPNGNENSYGGNNGSGESSYGNHNNNSPTENYEQNAGASEGYYASNDNSSGAGNNENTNPSYALNSQSKKSSDGTGNKASKEKKSASTTDEKAKEKPEENPKEDSKEDSKKISPTAAPSVHKITALGTVFSAVGMAKNSPELKFYNSNHENKEETQNTDENYNKTIYFHHAKTVSINEYPEIKLVKTEENQDVTILSLRLNGEEASWHQEGDALILDEPITKKTNFIELLAVLDGKKIVKMPVWTIE